MKIAGIIAEYNPFHRGHLHQLEVAKSKHNIDHVVAIMSGDFVQRGEPAIFDKYARAQMATAAGIDLVMELPFCYATASAKDFATGAITMMNKLGAMDCLVFGAECDDLAVLKEIAKILVEEPPDFGETIKECMSKGDGFARARALALEKIIPGSGDIINKPNNILAIEYLAALIKTKSTIEPILIKREGGGYQSLSMEDERPSASAIRKAILDEADPTPGLPENIWQMFKDSMGKCGPIYQKDFTQFLQHELLLFSKDEDEILDLEESLANRLAPSFSTMNFEEVAESIKTREVTKTHVNRGLLHLMTRLTTKKYMAMKDNGYIYYGHVLAMKKSGGAVMRIINEKTSIPCFTGFAGARENLPDLGKCMLDYDILATRLYNAAVYNKFDHSLSDDFTHKFQVT